MQQKMKRQGIQPLSLEILPPPSEFSESCISDSPPPPLVVYFDFRNVSYCGRTNLKKKKKRSKAECRIPDQFYSKVSQASLYVTGRNRIVMYQ